MQTIRKTISALTNGYAIAFLVSFAILMASEQIRADKTSFPLVMLSSGCFLHAYSIHNLALLLAFVTLLMAYRAEEKLITEDNVYGMSRWKMMISSKRLEQETSWLCLLPVFGRLMIVLYFVTRMSYLFNHCQ